MAYLKTLVEVQNVLDAATEANSIYNVDFKNVKDSLNRLYDKERKNATSIHHLNDRDSEEYAQETDVYYALPYGTHTLGGKTFAKVLDNAPDTEYVRTIKELVAKYVPLAAQVKALKAVVVKGRKPSDKVADQRTLENTGTCAICGRNVKMLNGRIVAHGYHIQFGFQSGNCFGVGYEPIEVSNEALVAYIDVLSNFSLTLSERIAKRKVSDSDVVITRRYSKDTVITKDHKQFEQYRANVIAQMEQEKIATKQAIVETDMRIKNWKPRALPI